MIYFNNKLIVKARKVLIVIKKAVIIKLNKNKLLQEKIHFP